MAKIHEEILVVKFSKLVKDTDTDPGTISTADVVDALAQVAQELAGAGVIVEVDVAQ